MILRNMLATFGKRSAYSKAPGSFVPYFQYKIGDYQPDQYLYFPSEQFATRYKNEIFNKLHGYTGYDIIKYLEFHYAAYPDRLDFLHFLHYEIFERLKKQPKDPGLLSTLAWSTEKKEELKKGQEEQIPHADGGIERADHCQQGEAAMAAAGSFLGGLGAGHGGCRGQ